MRVLRIRIGGRLMASDNAGNQKPNATHPLQVPLSLETYMREPVNIHNTEATARTAKRIENLAGVASQQVTTAAMGCIGPDVMPIDDRTDRAGRSYKFSSERRWCYSFLCRSRSRMMNVLCVCYSSVCAGFRCSEMVGVYLPVLVSITLNISVRSSRSAALLPGIPHLQRWRLS